MLLIDLFLLRESPYRHARENPKSHLWASGLLFGTGALYGLLLALFQRMLGGEIQGIPVDRFPNMILFAGNLIAGVLVILVFHGGATLIVWLMARAVGGLGRLADLYRATSYLAPLASPALPQLAYGSTAVGKDASLLPLYGAYFYLAWVGVILVLAGLYQLVRVTQGTSPRRSAAAVVLVALFSYSVLLLAS
jgi:hypothetical protein